MDIWRQMVAAKEAKTKAAQVQAAEDDARSQAAAAEEERVAVMLPTTARVPPHVRPAGVRRKPWHADDELSTNQPEDGQTHWFQHPSPLKPLESRQGAEQGSYREKSSRGMLQQQESFLSDEPPRDHSFAEEWSQELDRAFREQLPPRGVNTMSFLKQKFMRSGTLEAAREVERRIRHECVLMGEGGSNALRHMEPAFLDPRSYCSAILPASTPRMSAAAVPQLDLAGLQIAAPNDQNQPPSAGKCMGGPPQSSGPRSTINLAWT